jgi:hypothetical protein
MRNLNPFSSKAKVNRSPPSTPKRDRTVSSDSPSPNTKQPAKRNCQGDPPIDTEEMKDDERASLLRDIVALLDTKLDEKLKSIVTKVEASTNSVHSRMDKVQREKNIIVFGIEETDKEDLDSLLKAAEALFASMKVADVMIDDIFRLGKRLPGAAKPRPIKIKPLRMVDKKRIMAGKRNLGKSKVSVMNDLSPEDRKSETLLRIKFREMKANDKDLYMSIRGGKMYVMKNKKLIDTVTANERPDGIDEEMGPD